MDLQDDLKIYSEEVRDVLNEPPKSILRWGSTLLAFFIIMLFGISYFIKYPDIVSTEITITTTQPPHRGISRSSGRIEKLFVSNYSLVEPFTPIAVIENTANFNDVFFLKKLTDTLSVAYLVHFPFHLFSKSELGSVESAFSTFQREVLEVQLNLEIKPYQIEYVSQKLESRQLNQRLELAIGQRDITKEELKLQRQDLERYEKIFEKGVISAQELEKQRLMYLQAEKNFKSILNNIEQIRTAINELNKTAVSTKNKEEKEESHQNRELYQTFMQLQKAIREWEIQFVLYSPIKGRISYMQVWSENQFINVGELIFTTVPENQNSYIGKARAMAVNTGKLKHNQRVNIRLQNYPDREYGLLEGRVKHISFTPDSEGFIVLDIELSNGLTTTYNKTIDFRQEMTGRADVITDDLRLIERILFQFRDLFQR